MIHSRRILGLAVLSALWATAAGAQTPSASAQPAVGTADSTLRLTTTTANGDTGLWYVPTAEVLARGKWSAGVYRTGFNYREGFTAVADFPITFGIGVSKRVELFGSFKAVSRIDRDIRPVFTSDPKVGGVVGQYPFVKQGWSGSQLGDLLVGAKFNLVSEADNKPAAFAERGMVKLPTGDTATGVSTGKLDGLFDVSAVAGRLNREREPFRGRLCLDEKSSHTINVQRNRLPEHAVHIEVKPWPIFRRTQLHNPAPQPRHVPEKQRAIVAEGRERVKQSVR